jgi:hypothetical protein
MYLTEAKPGPRLDRKSSGVNVVKGKLDLTLFPGKASWNLRLEKIISRN